MTSPTQSFFAVELTTFKPGAATITFDQGHGAHPRGTLAQFPDQVQSTGTIYASDLGYRTAPTDADPTRPYPPTINRAFQMQRALNLDPAASAAGAAWGTLALSNADGGFNALAGTWNSDGRALRILYGTKTLEDTPKPGFDSGDFTADFAAASLARFIFLDPAYTTLTRYFTGMAQTWTLTETELQIPVRDATYWLERPLQTTLYLGTGNYESPVPYTGAPPPPPNSTSLQGMTKPKTRGGSANYPIRNITPILVDPVNLIYQYNDAPGTVVALYEGGNPSITFQADVADLYTGSTNSGQYRTSNARGMFQLGSNPVNAITCDVTGAFPDGTTHTTLADIAYNLLVQDLTVPAANVEETSFIDLPGKPAFGNLYPWTAGVYFPSEGTVYVPFSGPTAKSTDGVAAISQLLAGVGAQLYAGRDGALRIMLLTAIPAGTTPLAAWDATNTVSVASRPMPANLNPPPFRVRVGYQHNYTVQQQSSLSPSINTSLLQFVQAQDRYAAASSNAVLTAYNRPNDPAPVPTALLNAVDAQTAANNLIALWGTRRRLYDVVVPLSIGVPRDIGDVVRLTWPMDDLRNGQLGRIVGETFASGDPTITFTVLV